MISRPFRLICISGIILAVALIFCTNNPSNSEDLSQNNNTEPASSRLDPAPALFTSNSDIKNVASWTFWDKLNSGYYFPTLTPVDLSGNLAFAETFDWSVNGATITRRRIL